LKISLTMSLMNREEKKINDTEDGDNGKDFTFPSDEELPVDGESQAVATGEQQGPDTEQKNTAAIGKIIEKQEGTMREKATDEAVIESFLEKFGDGRGTFFDIARELRYESGKDQGVADFSRVLEAVQRNTYDGMPESEDIAKAREIIEDSVDKQLNFMTAREGVKDASGSPDTIKTFIRRMGKDAVAGDLKTIEKTVTALNVPEVYFDRIEEVRNALEEAA